MLIEQTLWGTRDKVQIAIERLRSFEPREGYYLAFSGGKDSSTILRLAEMSGVQYDAHYNVTTIDPPELVKFIKAEHPGVERHRPEMSMFQLILKVKFWPPMRQQRWCCELLKERGGAGRVVLTGIRWQESQKRKSRKMVEPCFKDAAKTYVHPIIDWSTHDVWEFIRLYDVPYCGLYDEGHDRLGCVLCPYGGHPKAEVERWPKITKAFVNTFDRLIEVRAAQGKKTSFKTGQEMFDWWIRRNSKARNKRQMSMDL
jgi:phosphoadenosine phosphosulfate reductase